MAHPVLALWARALCPAAVAGWLVAMGSAAAADAPRPSEAQRCAGAAAPAQRVEACTAVIGNPGLPPGLAALSYFYRGFARRDLRDNEAALADFSAALARDPALWPARWARAELAVERRDYATASAEWSEVIKRHPQISSLYAKRGSALDDAGHPAEALADFTKAIEAAGQKDPVARFFLDRGVAYEGVPDLAKARADFDEAIRRDGRLARAYAGRGRTLVLTGDAAAAVADFAKASELDPGDLYMTLWLFVAEARAGRDAIAALRQRAARLDLKPWPGPIVEMLLGSRAADAPGDPPRYPAGWSAEARSAGARCEISFYLAEAALAKGERERAATLFRTATQAGVLEFIEHRSAAAELRRLGS